MAFFVTDHRLGDQVQHRIRTVSDYRVRQVRDRGLGAIHMVCVQADNKADVVPCDRLPFFMSCESRSHHVPTFPAGV